MSAIIHFLTWLGLTHRTAENGKLFVPFGAPPRWTWKHWYKFGKLYGYLYRFHNLPGVQSRIPGRVLPWRWGFGICGLEFGDRGSLRYQRCPVCYAPLHQFRPWNHVCQDNK